MLPGQPSDYVLVVFGFLAIGCVFWISRQFPVPPGSTSLLFLERTPFVNVTDGDIEPSHDGGRIDEEGGFAERGIQPREWAGEGVEPAVKASVNISLPSAALILLHGLGDSPTGVYSRQFQRHVKEGGGLEHVKWIVPSAPFSPVTCNGGHVMPSWFDMPEIPVREDSPPSTEEEVFKAVSTVHSLIDKLQLEGIPASRILVAGMSQGAATTLVSVLSYRDRLAGGVAMWGWLPLAPEVLLARTRQGSKETPLCWSHGSADPVVLFGNAKKGCRWIRDELHANCELHGHELAVHKPHDAEYELLHLWIRTHLPSLDEKR
eukprot:TRINITY_DN20201_c0_g1_i1.p1 TRINITY_DN20201_c0_g1~~TRINITY_DN20201_c0_g1_i1.p1  ORF type:complete len:319 (-),score=20.65 TRINITY_DN20201_c0_g1_i1:109-1065(-)